MNKENEKQEQMAIELGKRKWQGREAEFFENDNDDTEPLHPDHIPNTHLVIDEEFIKRHKEKTLHIISFGHRYGKPQADFLRSIRHLPNPSKELRHKYNGTHARLQKEFFLDRAFSFEYNRLERDVFGYLNIHEDMMDITVAIGCEYGKHRSVAMVEKLSTASFGRIITITHRDINK